MTANQTLESRFLALLREKGGSITIDERYDLVDITCDLDCHIDELNDVVLRLMQDYRIKLTLEEAKK